MSNKFIFALFLPIVLLAGCTSSRQLDEISLRMTVIEQQNRSIEDKLIELDSLSETLLEALTVFKARTEFSDEAGDARLEEISSKLNDVLDRAERLQDDLTALQLGLTKTQIADSAAVGTDTAAEKLTYVDASKLFDRAFKDLTAGDYALAVLGFTEYVKLYPKTDQADDAQFLIGEAYYRQKDYSRAKSAYIDAEKSYPDSDRMPTVLYKLGRCYQELGDKKNAKKYFNLTIDKFPETQEAELAKGKLGG